jgi:4-hydroxybenzoate polyprenyltransferase
MRLAAFKDLTRIDQTFFALPFVLGSAILSLSHATFSARWLWILPAFLLARISGMAFNQLIDRHIDARNPRTEKRALPTGRVTLGQARFVAWCSLAVFLIICLQINLLTVSLAPLAALLIYLYSYMKRFHYSCHLMLGCVHFLGPVMACTAIQGTISLPSLFLGGVAGLSIAGTDIAYAIQDYAFDRANGLFSIPAVFGIEKGLFISSCFHFFCLLMLLCVGLSAHLSFLYFLVLPVVGGIYAYFHSYLHLHKKDFKRIEATFYLCTVAVSFSVLFFIGVDAVWRVL